MGERLSGLVSKGKGEWLWLVVGEDESSPHHTHSLTHSLTDSLTDSLTESLTD